jgi:hypothetical protein
MMCSDTTAFEVTSESERQHALDVLTATYAREKRWVQDAADLFPAAALATDDVSWVLATVNDAPAGVLRVHFDPPLDQYRTYDFDPLGEGASLDVDAFVQQHRIAQIGPFAVLPEYRRRFRVVFWLMRVAGAETLQRGYTHYVTDVFENEEHSPYQFHTRVLGFQPVATHEAGEMDCLHRRITLVLNLHDAYERLRDSQNRLYQFLTDGLDAPLLHQLSA